MLSVPAAFEVSSFSARRGCLFMSCQMRHITSDDGRSPVPGSGDSANKPGVDGQVERQSRESLANLKLMGGGGEPRLVMSG